MLKSNCMRILLVEDDNGHALLIEENLKNSGIINSITRVKDGEEAINFLIEDKKDKDERRYCPLLILLDLNLPKKSGLEVLKEIKTDERFRRIPVIILTTTHDEREINTVYELGANEYIVKPVDFSDFKDTINRLGLFLQVVSLPNNEQKNITL